MGNKLPTLGSMKPVAIIIIIQCDIAYMAAAAMVALFLSPIDVPEYIPHTPIKILGFLFCGFMLTILIISQKEALEKDSALRIVNLVCIGTAICFIMEVFFQLVQSFTNDVNKLHYFISGVVSTTIFGAILSFFVAFQLKTKRTGRLVLFIFILLVLFKILIMAFPMLEHP